MLYVRYDKITKRIIGSISAMSTWGIRLFCKMLNYPTGAHLQATLEQRIVVGFAHVLDLARSRDQHIVDLFLLGSVIIVV